VPDPFFNGPPFKEGAMKSKGPVDFFLGVFLEFGAAFCLLFFLPQVPWQWLPAEGAKPSPTSASLGFAVSDRRVMLRPAQPTPSTYRPSQPTPSFREAPPLIPAEVEPNHLPASAPSRPPTSFYSRTVPRPYQY
jgi:hypothetical protein